MIRKHFTLDSKTNKYLEEISKTKKWSEAGVVRVAINYFYQRELAPLNFAKAKLGRPKKEK